MRISKIGLFVVAMLLAVNVKAETTATKAEFSSKDKEAAEYCKNLDVKKIEELKNAATTSAVGGIIGAASGIGGVATSIAGGMQSGGKAKQGLDIASTITSATGSVAGIVSLSASGAGLANIEGIFDTINKCVDKMSNL